jgi:hypothetical protein
MRSSRVGEEGGGDAVVRTNLCLMGSLASLGRFAYIETILMNT